MRDEGATPPPADGAATPDASGPAQPTSDAPAEMPPPPPPPPASDAGYGAVPPPTPPVSEPGYAAVPPPVPVPEPVAQPAVGMRYDVPQDQKNLALLSTLGMLIVGFLSPLLVYLLTTGDPAKRFANDHAKEGLNFSIVYFISWIIAFALMLILIGFVLIPFLVGWGLWVIIAGAIQASNGEAPHYPLVMKILK